MILSQGPLCGKRECYLCAMPSQKEILMLLGLCINNTYYYQFHPMEKNYSIVCFPKKIKRLKMESPQTTECLSWTDSILMFYHPSATSVFQSSAITAATNLLATNNL